MSGVRLIGTENLWSTRCAIYTIETATAGTVFMRVNRSNHRNDKRAVVIVDAARFIQAWQAYPHRREPTAFMKEAGWRADRKFGDAQTGFAHGRDNPVPIAVIGVHDTPHAGGPGSVAFINGITRTIWLLANGAKAFPIECQVSEADLLHRTAGCTSWPFQTVEEVTSMQTAVM